MSSIVPNSFVVISDIHSNKEAVQKIKKFYLNEYEKIYVLGDITGRGVAMGGCYSFEVLNYLYDLIKQYPERIVYVPGNHDQMLYGYHRGAVNRDLLLKNGESDTWNHYVNRYEFFGDKWAKKFEEMIEWIGRQPIQVSHTFDGKKYVLAHALFNQKLYDYNPNLCLKDYFDYKEQGINDSVCSDIFTTLWFRKGNDKYQFSFNSSNLPINGEIMVIGHTPTDDRATENLDLINRNGEVVKVYCVDGGTGLFRGMLKYDGKEKVIKTQILEEIIEFDDGRLAPHVDTSPKSLATKTEDMSFREYTIPSNNIIYINLFHDSTSGYDNYFINLDDANKLGIKPLINPYQNYIPITVEELQRIRTKCISYINEVNFPKQSVEVYYSKAEGSVNYFVVDYVLSCVNIRDASIPWGDPVGKIVAITEEQYNLLDRYYKVSLIPKFGTPGTGFGM